MKNTTSESINQPPPVPEGYTYRGTKLSELGDVDHKDVAVWHRGWLQGWVTDLAGPLEAQRGLHYAVRTSESTPIAAILRAMANNYGARHHWDRLDSEACVKAADKIEALEREARSLRMIFPEILKALGNGSFCSGERNSIEFLEGIPDEVRLFVQGHVKEARRLRAALETLVRAKDEKDSRGYTALYVQLKTGAWERAREALSQGTGGGRALPLDGEVCVIDYEDNSTGDHDRVVLIARFTDGQWFHEESGTTLLQYQGDAIHEWWPLRRGEGNKVA